MSYRIVYEKPAVKFIRRQPPEQRSRILKAIEKLPYQGDVKRLAGRPGEWRLRVGSYRILYTIDDDILLFRVLDAGSRGEIYT